MISRLAAVAIVLATIAPARASTVMTLGPAALEAGAERIVDGTIVARSTRWNAAHDGLETHATLAVSATRKGPITQTAEIVVAGGELDGARQIVFGMPALAIGERARWFLRDRGDGTLRVYGWAQGKWPERFVGGAMTFAPAPVVAERDSTVAEFAKNGMVWPAGKIPVQYLVQTAGSQDIPLAQEIAAIDAAFATWQAVPTASLTYHNAGMTNLGMAIDDINVILFIESGWIFGSEAAAATSLFIIDGMQTADIAVNGENFHWAIGPPGSGITTNLLDLQAVLTHEIGHFSGLGHTERAFDTMYFAWKPWQGQRNLSIDDKLGLSAVYPIAGNECTTRATCLAEEKCTQHPLGRLCEATPDPIGSICNYDRVECDSFCLFTIANLSMGYCSKFCETDTDCPLTHHCADASQGTMPVKVCFLGPQPPPPPPCTGDDACPGGEHCDVANGVCTFECRTSDDCSAGSTCDARGSCVLPDGGACRSSGEPPILAGLALVWIFVLRRRR
jgi:MYXO-CTERM domain-containing protein